MAKAVVIDDNPDTPIAIQSYLGGDHTVLRHTQGALVLDFIQDEQPSIVFLNLDLCTIDPLELLASLSARRASPPVVAFTSNNEPQRIVDAVKRGAVTVVHCPLQPESLRRSFVAAIASRTPVSGGIEYPPVPGIVGTSTATIRLREAIGRYSDCSAPVLITGDSGVGKELVASSIHRLSRRSHGPFVAINCAAIPDSLFESEMFGTSRGAFTDAHTRDGALERANGGTLFLDEVGELTLSAQVKLLRALETKSFTRVGDTSCRTVDFRLIAATNRDLRQEVDQLRFRLDLYYRINVVRIRVLPLRERPQDIPALAHHFRAMIGSAENATALPEFSASALDRLMSHSWPGNVRELKNVIWRAMLSSDGTQITLDNIDFDS